MSGERRPKLPPRHQRGFSFQDLASVVELSHHPSCIGALLRSYPDWLLRGADKWAEQGHDCQNNREMPNRLPVPDPWQFFLEIPGLPADHREVFQAAQSWIAGFCRLCHLATGIATLNTDWLEQAEKAKANGNLDGYYRAMTKIADKLSPSRVFQEDTRKHAGSPEIIEQMEWYARQRQKKIVHRARDQRIKSEGFNPQFRLTEIEKDFPVEFSLVESWLCFHNCPLPGLMFWRNEAITKWLFAKLGFAQNRHGNLGFDYIKKIRQRLKLRTASEKSPLVWSVEAVRLDKSSWKLKGVRRNGEMLFEGKVVTRQPLS